MDFLLPTYPGLKLTDLEVDEQQLILSVTSTTPIACCPVHLCTIEWFCFFPDAGTGAGISTFDWKLSQWFLRSVYGRDRPEI
jgi:hypothetical protein